MEAAFEIALSFAAGYLVGTVPIGLLVGWAAGIDIRRYGTGGIGASNVLHNLGLFPAGLVALGVLLQGLLPPLLARALGGSEAAVAAAALGAVVGYGWPVFVRSGGGRGVGVSTGAAAVISPGGFVALLAAYALGGLLRQMGLATLLGFIFYTGWVFYFAGSMADRLTALLLVALIVVRRLEGVGEDLERGTFVQVILDRLLFDHRPGQHLSGPRGD